MDDLCRRARGDFSRDELVRYLDSEKDVKELCDAYGVGALQRIRVLREWHQSRDHDGEDGDAGNDDEEERKVAAIPRHEKDSQNAAAAVAVVSGGPSSSTASNAAAGRQTTREREDELAVVGVGLPAVTPDRNPPCHPEAAAAAAKNSEASNDTKRTPTRRNIQKKMAKCDGSGNLKDRKIRPEKRKPRNTSPASPTPNNDKSGASSRQEKSDHPANTTTRSSRRIEQRNAARSATEDDLPSTPPSSSRKPTRKSSETAAAAANPEEDGGGGGGDPPKQYCFPSQYLSRIHIRSGAYSILMTLHFCAGEHDGLLTKEQMVQRGQKFCDSPFLAEHYLVNERFAAWQPAIRTLEKHELAERKFGRKEDRTHRFQLTENGKRFVEALFHKRAEDIVATPVKDIQASPSSGSGDSAALLPDKIEAQKRLQSREIPSSPVESAKKKRKQIAFSDFFGTAAKRKAD